MSEISDCTNSMHLERCRAEKISDGAKEVMAEAVEKKLPLKCLQKGSQYCGTYGQKDRNCG